MKHSNLFQLKHIRHTLVCGAVLLFSSCAIGYDSDLTFSPGVTNAQLESPQADEVTVTKDAKETQLTVTWPVVIGAGGYEFSMYNVDDPDNPVAVGQEKEVIDGCTTTRSLQADTQYKIVIRTLGNAQYNNAEAKTATEISYTTLVPTYKTIPAGDISAWFEENPIPDDRVGEELAYVLESGASYTMSKAIDFGKQKVTFRGDKTRHAVITMAKDARISTTAGLKIKFITFDCTAFDGASSTGALLLLSSTPDESIKGTGDYYIINDPVVIQSCEVRGLPRHLVYDNKKKYCLSTLLIDGCDVELTTTQEQSVIYFNQGFANNMTVENSTFWHNGTKANKCFLEYNGSARPTRAGFAKGSVNYLNSTFYHVCYNKQWGNYNGMAGQSSVEWVMKNNIFVDCGKGEVARRLLGSRKPDGKNVIATFGNNTYWYNGAFSDGEKDYDNSGKYIETDPMLKDPAHGDCTVGGAEQIAARTGASKWLPKESTETEAQ